MALEEAIIRGLWSGLAVVWFGNFKCGEVSRRGKTGNLYVLNVVLLETLLDRGKEN